MKQKFLKLLQLSLLLVATVSANCPSQLNFYQPEIPKNVKVFYK